MLDRQSTDFIKRNINKTIEYFTRELRPAHRKKAHKKRTRLYNRLTAGKFANYQPLLQIYSDIKSLKRQDSYENKLKLHESLVRNTLKVNYILSQSEEKESSNDARDLAEFVSPINSVPNLATFFGFMDALISKFSSNEDEEIYKLIDQVNPNNYYEKPKGNFRKNTADFFKLFSKDKLKKLLDESNSIEEMNGSLRLLQFTDNFKTIFSLIKETKLNNIELLQFLNFINIAPADLMKKALEQSLITEYLQCKEEVKKQFKEALYTLIFLKQVSKETNGVDELIKDIDIDNINNDLLNITEQLIKSPSDQNENNNLKIFKKVFNRLKMKNPQEFMDFYKNNIVQSSDLRIDKLPFAKANSRTNVLSDLIKDFDERIPVSYASRNLSNDIIRNFYEFISSADSYGKQNVINSLFKIDNFDNHRSQEEVNDLHSNNYVDSPPYSDLFQEFTFLSSKVKNALEVIEENNKISNDKIDFQNFQNFQKKYQEKFNEIKEKLDEGSKAPKNSLNTQLDHYTLYQFFIKTLQLMKGYNLNLKAFKQDDNLQSMLISNASPEEKLHYIESKLEIAEARDITNIDIKEQLKSIQEKLAQEKLAQETIKNRHNQLDDLVKDTMIQLYIYNRQSFRPHNIPVLDSLSTQSRKEAIQIAHNSSDNSRSFWNLAYLFRSFKKKTSTANSPETASIEAFRQRLIQNYTTEADNRALALKMFDSFGENPNETKYFNTSNPSKYPGPGYIFKGINPDKALGIFGKDPEKVTTYKKQVLKVLNSSYAHNTPHKYDAALENAKDSTFYFTRGFIAIKPPDKTLFKIPTQRYPDAKKRDKDYSPESEYANKLLERNLEKNREHYSLILLNDHYGRDSIDENAEDERAFLIPSKVLENLIDPYALSLDDSSYKSFQNATPDLSEAKVFFHKIREEADRLSLPVLDLTTASLFGSMSNAFPHGSDPYHEWEKHVPHESKDRSNLRHIHKTHAYGGYITNPFRLMDFYPSLQEADQIVSNISKSTNAIYDIFKIAKANYSKGILHKKVSPMFQEAQQIHDNLSGENKDKFPLLCISDYRDGLNLNSLPRLDLYLDTYDMSIHRKVMGEDYVIASSEKDGNELYSKFKEIFIDKSFFDEGDANRKFYLNEHLLFYPRHLFEKYSNSQETKSEQDNSSKVGKILNQDAFESLLKDYKQRLK